MKRFSTARAGAAIIAMLLACATAAANDERPDALPLVNGPLRVRIYNAPGVPLGSALDAAARIFDASGIDVTWVLCSDAEAVHALLQASCETTPIASDVAVQVIPVPVSSVPAGSLGVAYLDARTWTGTLASVFTDRIDAAAARLGVDRDALFGRVIAHEIGHLLGLRHRSSTYLMRAHWRDEMLQRTGASDFQFSRQQARQIREDVLRRVSGNMAWPAMPDTVRPARRPLRPARALARAIP